MGELRKIVVGVDGSAPSLAALQWAVDEAARSGACIDAVYAYAYPIVPAAHPAVVVVPTDRLEQEGRNILDVAIAGIEGAARASITPRVVQGVPGRVLAAEASDADLLVVGTRGHGGVKGLLLGSVSHHVTRHSPCPVVVVPAPDERHRGTAARAGEGAAAT